MAELVDRLGYDAVDFGPLADSWRSQPGTTPVNVQPCMAELPEGLRAEEVLRWSSRPRVFRCPPPGSGNA